MNKGAICRIIFHFTAFSWFSVRGPWGYRIALWLTLIWWLESSRPATASTWPILLWTEYQKQFSELLFIDQFISSILVYFLLNDHSMKEREGLTGQIHGTVFGKQWTSCAVSLTSISFKPNICRKKDSSSDKCNFKTNNNFWAYFPFLSTDSV